MRTDLIKYSHSQKSIEWYKARAFSANSSSYSTYFNIFGDREKTLKSVITETYWNGNYYTSFGNAFEKTSGFIFSEITGNNFKELGSVPHAEYERIRGSVDGYGTGVIDSDIGIEDFVLEIKTPAKRFPSSSLDNDSYYQQII